MWALYGPVIWLLSIYCGKTHVSRQEANKCKIKNRQGNV